MMDTILEYAKFAFYFAFPVFCYVAAGCLAIRLFGKRTILWK